MGKKVIEMVSKRFELFAVLIAAAIIVLIAPTVSAENVNVAPVTTPFITIDPIGNHTIGEVFFINGTTNLPVSENLTIGVFPVTFHHGLKGYIEPEPGIVVYTIPIVSATNGINHWSANITDGNWIPGEFVATVVAREHEAGKSHFFNIFPANTFVAPPSTLSQTANKTIGSPSLIPTHIILPTLSPTQHVTPFPVILLIIVFTGIVILRSFNRKKRE